MTVHFMVTYAIPSGRPSGGAVIDDASGQCRIVTSNPKAGDERNKIGKRAIDSLQRGNPEASLADVLSGYLGKSGYVRLSPWTVSPHSFNETVSRLSDFLSSLRHGAALRRSARLAKIVSASHEIGANRDTDDGTIVIVRDAAEETERLSKPGLGYPVPSKAEKRRIIAGLLARPKSTDQVEPKVVVVPEEVADEREDVSRPQESS